VHGEPTGTHGCGCASALFASPKQASTIPASPTLNFLNASRRVTDWANPLANSSNLLIHTLSLCSGLMRICLPLATTGKIRNRCRVFERAFARSDGVRQPEAASTIPARLTPNACRRVTYEHCQGDESFSTDYQWLTICNHGNRPPIHCKSSGAQGSTARSHGKKSPQEGKESDPLLPCSPPRSKPAPSPPARHRTS
jgi:hypothetical protein